MSPGWSEESGGRPGRFRRVRTWCTAGAAAGAVAAALVLSGCGSLGADTAGAADAARAFHRAVDSGDGEGACALLSSRAVGTLHSDTSKPCRTAITQQGIPRAGAVRTSEVYGRNGRVVMDGDTVFVSEFDDGWRVIGVGCQPVGPDRPYDCAVAGD